MPEVRLYKITVLSAILLLDWYNQQGFTWEGELEYL